MSAQRGFAAIGLFNPKTPANVGSVLRAAHCYGAAFIAKTGRRYERAPTDVTKAFRHLPLLQVDDLFDAIPRDCVPVAVDLIDGARDLTTYVHPERAYYIFGPEDGTLGKAITDRCRDKVFIPTAFCLNLATACTTVLYDRHAKQAREASPLRIVRAGAEQLTAQREAA
jgi:tRNA(Leu) C34 or U34 (ribose-2'-O)-methylase TrmL